MQKEPKLSTNSSLGVMLLMQKYYFMLVKLLPLVKSTNKMPKERKQNVFFYQAAGNKEPKCLKLVLCQVVLHVVTTQFRLLKQVHFFNA